MRALAGGADGEAGVDRLRAIRLAVKGHVQLKLSVPAKTGDGEGVGVIILWGHALITYEASNS